MDGSPPIIRSHEFKTPTPKTALPSGSAPIIDAGLTAQNESVKASPQNASQVGDVVCPSADMASGQTEDSISQQYRLKSVDFQRKSETRPVSTRSVLRAVQAMHDPGEGARRPPICYCGSPRLSDVDVHLREDETGRKKAGVSGIWRCRNGEICPLCAEAATARRRAAYARVGRAAIEKGGRIVTLVLSACHGTEDKLADLMSGVKKASTGARAGNSWYRGDKQRLGCVGVLVDNHVRYGERHGWHYHQHLTLLCLNPDEAAIHAAIRSLVERYVRLLERHGLRADADLQHVKILKAEAEAEASSYTYPADHNRADDDTSHDAEDYGEEKSLSPLMLAERAAIGDERSAELFMEFSKAVKGTRSVVVTPSIATALKIERQVEEPPVYTEQNRLGRIPGSVWSKLLDTNLANTFLNRVESAGRDGWQTVRWWALEQAGEAPTHSVKLANELALAIHAQQRVDGQTAKELAQLHIDALQATWTNTHGADLVAATVDYVAAHRHNMKLDPRQVQIFMAGLEKFADKSERRLAYRSPDVERAGPSESDRPSREFARKRVNSRRIQRGWIPATSEPRP